MPRWFAEEAVVVVKQIADEDMVTYVRVKRFERAVRWRRRAEYVNDKLIL